MRLLPKELFCSVVCIILVVGCSDNASKNSRNVDGPSADDPIVSLTLNMTPNEGVVLLGSEVQFEWFATSRSGIRYTNIEAQFTPPELTGIDTKQIRSVVSRPLCNWPRPGMPL